MKRDAVSDLRSRLGDLRQSASVRRIVLDDGAERGVRALAFSTGGGLGFWVLSDRSLDIGPLWLRGEQIAWQAPGGFVAPSFLDAESEDGRGFNRGFSGFLVTCGLRHIRQPALGEPLHGRLPFTPARVSAYGEDWDSPEPVLFVEGDVLETRYGGVTLHLRRRIEAPIGGRTLRIRDTVENAGPTTVRHAVLYHFNLGWPVVRPGATVSLDGVDLLGPLKMPEAAAAPAKTWPCESENARVRIASIAGSAACIDMSFKTGTLGFLQLWRDLRRNVGVLSIEPVSTPPDGEGHELAPGETRSYAIDMAFTATEAPDQYETATEGHPIQ